MNQNMKIFGQENALENGLFKMTAVLFGPQLFKVTGNHLKAYEILKLRALKILASV